MRKLVCVVVVVVVGVTIGACGSKAGSGSGYANTSTDSMLTGPSTYSIISLAWPSILTAPTVSASCSKVLPPGGRRSIAWCRDRLTWDGCEKSFSPLRFSFPG